MRSVYVQQVFLMGWTTQVSCISFEELFEDSKEKYEAVKEDEIVQKSVAKTKEGVEQIKEGIETVKKVKRGVENTIEFAQDVKTELDALEAQELAEKQLKLASDLQRATVSVVDHGHYLMCDLTSSGEPFEILEDIILVTPYTPNGVQWYVNEVPLKSLVQNCGQLGSGGTMVRDGVSCYGYAKYFVDALFPYMVPWPRQDTDTFACSRLFTLDLGVQFKGVFIKPSDDKVIDIHSETVQWKGWHILKDQRGAGEAWEFMELLSE